jgi:acetate kinase
VRVLVVNAGSRTVKLTVVNADDTATTIDTLDHADRYSPDAVAHRVVHGGREFAEPVVIDDAVRDALAATADLAPLHTSAALGMINTARARFAPLPHVAVFDTAFHRTIPLVARTYALPAALRDGLGVRRYGFHGLSVAWAASRVHAPRLVVCHLGGGSSVTAVRDGRSVDTTMGFTPLEGVPMTTRSGSVDPGAMLYALRHGYTVDELDRLLEHESGLAGIGGFGGDAAALERAAAAGDDNAELALAVFCYRVATMVGAMVVTLGGLDALVFTAGIGEHSATIRARICDTLGVFGARLDRDANATATGDREISVAGAKPRIVVLAAREDLVAARAARSVLADPARR